MGEISVRACEAVEQSDRPRGGREGLGDWVLTARLRILERERGGG